MTVFHKKILEKNIFLGKKVIFVRVTKVNNIDNIDYRQKVIEKGNGGKRNAFLRKNENISLQKYFFLCKKQTKLLILALCNKEFALEKI